VVVRRGLAVVGSRRGMLVVKQTMITVVGNNHRILGVCLLFYHCFILKNLTNAIIKKKVSVNNWKEEEEK
jgi:hypothetical protein